MIRVIEIVAGIWNVIISILILGCVVTLFYKKKHKRFFKSYFILLIDNLLFQTGDMLAWVFRGNTSRIGYYLVRVSNLTFFVGMAFLPISIGWYLVELIRISHPRAGGRFMTMMRIASASMLLLIIVNLFYPWLYYFDANNIYHRASGVMMILLHVIGFASTVIIHWYSWYYRNIQNHASVRTIGICCLLLEVAVVYQAMFYGISAGNIAATAGFLFIFTSSIKEQTMEFARSEAQLNESRENLIDTRQKMLQLQIRPHFLFNSMSAIQTLVLENQEQAYEAIGTLSTLLRTCIHFSEAGNLVAIEEELRFIESYGTLQSLRFRDQLSIEMDIQDFCFELPPLTIQPLVENSINHGLKPLGHKGMIFVRTYEDMWNDRNYHVIEVEDNGVGIAPGILGEVMNRQTEHLGISNTRQRIEEGCGGTFEVISPVKSADTDSDRPGTLIRIRLPRV